jgi:hypothetical protein
MSIDNPYSESAHEETKDSRPLNITDVIEYSSRPSEHKSTKSTKSEPSALDLDTCYPIAQAIPPPVSPKNASDIVPLSDILNAPKPQKPTSDHLFVDSLDTLAKPMQSTDVTSPALRAALVSLRDVVRTPEAIIGSLHPEKAAALHRHLTETLPLLESARTNARPDMNAAFQRMAADSSNDPIRVLTRQEASTLINMLARRARQ